MEAHGAVTKTRGGGSPDKGWNRSNSGSVPALALRAECNNARSDLPT